VTFLLPTLYYLVFPGTVLVASLTAAASSLILVTGCWLAGLAAQDFAFVAAGLAILNGVLVRLRVSSGALARSQWLATTKYRKALGDLAESRDLQDRIFEASPLPLVVTSMDSGRLVRANPAAADFLGRPLSIAEVEAAKSYVDPVDRNRLVREARTNGGVRNFRTLLRRNDGRQRSVLVDASALTHRGRDHLVTCIRDITDEEENARRLVAAEADYRAHFENSVVGIYRSSPSGAMLRANPALVRLNGYSTEAELIDAVGNIASEWYVDPTRREEWLALMRRDGIVTEFVSEVYRHRSRERIWISENGWCVHGPDNEPVYFEGMVIETTQRKLAEAEVKKLALIDDLTGLGNRRALYERLDAMIEASGHGGVFAAVLFMDLDRFKPVNDAFGHAAGDLLLKQAAERLCAVVGAGEVFRPGGDEFTALVPAEAARNVEEIASCIIAAFSRPFELDGPRALVGISIGIARLPHDGTDRTSVLAAADGALYEAKSQGRARYCVARSGLNDDLQMRRA
jgi:diguanylate cyclase (GGDEF)-like protein/PAS domain S-box-containing protein